MRQSLKMQKPPLFQLTAARRRLGRRNGRQRTGKCRFNSQPPEGGWVGNKCLDKAQAVSTHSRPKAAGRLALRP